MVKKFIDTFGDKPLRICDSIDALYEQLELWKKEQEDNEKQRENDSLMHDSEDEEKKADESEIKHQKKL